MLYEVGPKVCSKLQLELGLEKLVNQRSSRLVWNVETPGAICGWGIQEFLLYDCSVVKKPCFSFQSCIYFINLFKFFESFGLTILRLKIKSRFYYLKIGFKYIFARNNHKVNKANHYSKL